MSSLIQSWRDNSSKLVTNFENEKVSFHSKILENLLPTSASNVLVVPERPNTGFICPVTAEVYYVLLLTPSASRVD